MNEKILAILVIMGLLFVAGAVFVQADDSPYLCVTQGLFADTFGGSNVTSGFSVNGDVTADDFLLTSGGTCCGGGGGGGNTTAEIQEAVNESGANYNISVPCSLIIDDAAGGDTDFCADATAAGSGEPNSFTDVDNLYIYNNSGTITYNGTYGNQTINSSIDLRAIVNILWENFTGRIQAKTPQDVNLQNRSLENISNITVNHRVIVGLVTDLDSRIGISVVGDLDVIHTATESDDHALEIDVDAAGFGDVKGIDIVYVTGAISLGQDEEVILIDIDQSLSTGGNVIGIEILVTEGLATIYGLEAGALVNPIIQLSGIFVDMDSANNSGTDALTNFTSTTIDSPIFVNDDDYVIIGDANKFEELEFLLNTTSSNPGIKPTFEFSTGIGAWSTFSPADGTNGMRNTGVIAWLDSDIPTWDVGVGNEYLIRITRTQNSLSTIPIENKVQIASVVIYTWDKNGDLVVNEINATKIRLGGNIINSTIDLSSLFVNFSILKDTNETIKNWTMDNFVNLSWEIYSLTNFTADIGAVSWDGNLTGTGLSPTLKPCADNEILKYETATTSWLCDSDDVGSVDTNALDIVNTTMLGAANETIKNWTMSNFLNQSHVKFNVSLQNGTVQSGGNATLNGLHIDKLNDTHWKIWG